MKKGSIACLGIVTIALSVSAIRTSAMTSRWVKVGVGDKYENVVQIKENATTPAPVEMTTTNATNVCYYGVQRNASDSPVWTPQICGSEETSCMLLTSPNNTGFKLAACYDPTYNDGK